jgi:hypothetical protein
VSSSETLLVFVNVVMVSDNLLATSLAMVDRGVRMAAHFRLVLVLVTVAGPGLTIYLYFHYFKMYLYYY